MFGSKSEALTHQPLEQVSAAENLQAEAIRRFVGDIASVLSSPVSHLLIDGVREATASLGLTFDTLSFDPESHSILLKVALEDKDQAQVFSLQLGSRHPNIGELEEILLSILNDGVVKAITPFLENTSSLEVTTLLQLAVVVTSLDSLLSGVSVGDELTNTIQDNSQVIRKKIAEALTHQPLEQVPAAEKQEQSVETPPVEEVQATLETSLETPEVEGLSVEEVDIGSHGVLLTDLVKGGVVVDGRRLRAGVDEFRVVSEKSAEQYRVEMASIFGPDFLLQKGKIKELSEKREQRNKLIILIGVSYLWGNRRFRERLLQLVKQQGRPYSEAEVTQALSFLREMVESKSGFYYPGHLEKEVVERYIEILKSVYDLIVLDESGDSLGVIKTIKDNIPFGKTSDIRQRDVLHLALLLRQFAQNVSARREHRLNHILENLFS